MHSNDAFAISVCSSSFPVVEAARCTTEEKLLIDLHQLLFPEAIFVEDIAGIQLRGDASGEIFNGLADELASMSDRHHLTQ